ncbi:MAG: 5-formyltetrahydrofolate cyclo-ligase [Gammaproteobacteria bacterium]|nr:5-formyltetrahydrofolate cyclo-ligase [Gammaproteobacteria bacterium]
MLNKRQLGEQCRHTRGQVSALVRAQASRFAGLELPALLTRLARAKISKIAVYISVGSEFPTRELIQALLGQGYKVYAPAVEGETVMNFYPYSDGDNLESGPVAAIPQPRVRLQAVDPGELDVVFLPVVGYSRQGERLGQGGGYYDRLLGQALARAPARFPDLIGLAFSAQECAHIPTQAHDVLLNGVCTEERLHTFRPGTHLAAAPV